MITDEQFNRLPKYAQKEIQRLARQKPSKDERIFLHCLETVLKHCDNWRLNKKPINDAEGYVKLARIFADNAIDVIRD